MRRIDEGIIGEGIFAYDLQVVDAHAQVGEVANQTYGHIVIEMHGGIEVLIGGLLYGTHNLAFECEGQ
jgi:hypothetical protein